MKKTLLVICLALLIPKVAWTQELGSWTFDADLDGWIPGAGPAINFGGWTGLEGNPPGALVAGGLSLHLESDCFTVPTSRTVAVSADMRRPDALSNAVCVAAIDAFPDPGCGPIGGTALGEVVQRPGEAWERLETTVVLPPGFTSFRPFVFGGSLTDLSACIFDNVSVSAVPAPIPTLGAVGIWVLGSLVALAGLAVLRRRA